MTIPPERAPCLHCTTGATAFTSFPWPDDQNRQPTQQSASHRSGVFYSLGYNLYLCKPNALSNIFIDSLFLTCFIPNYKMHFACCFDPALQHWDCMCFYCSLHAVFLIDSFLCSLYNGPCPLWSFLYLLLLRISSFPFATFIVILPFYLPITPRLIRLCSPSFLPCSTSHTRSNWIWLKK